MSVCDERCSSGGPIAEKLTREPPDVPSHQGHDGGHEGEGVGRCHDVKQPDGHADWGEGGHCLVHADLTVSFIPPME